MMQLGYRSDEIALLKEVDNDLADCDNILASGKDSSNEKKNDDEELVEGRDYVLAD